MKVSIDGECINDFLLHVKLYCNYDLELCRGPLRIVGDTQGMAKVTTPSGRVAYGNHHVAIPYGEAYITIDELGYLDAIQELLSAGHLHRLTLIHMTVGRTGKTLEVNEDLYKDASKYTALSCSDVLEADYIRINNASV